MKFIIAGILMFCVQFAFASCPDISGTYQFSEHPWNGAITIEQNGCDQIRFSSTHLHLNRVLLRPNGVSYAGLADSFIPADAATVDFHKLNFESGRLVLRHFHGSLQECTEGYFYDRSDCHLTEYALVGLGRGEALWEQTGVWWREAEGAVRDSYPLQRFGPGPEGVATVKKAFELDPRSTFTLFARGKNEGLANDRRLFQTRLALAKDAASI